MIGKNILHYTILEEFRRGGLVCHSINETIGAKL